MSLCASCGRQRDDNARFCGGCGAEFTESPEGGETRTDMTPEPARGEPPAPDPFASWYQQQAPEAPRNEADSTWQPTQTVSAAPTGQAGYPPSGFTADNPFSAASPATPPAQPYQPGQPYQPAQPYQPGPPFQPGRPAGPPDRGGRRALFLVLAVIVVLAAGGGAYALATTLGKHGAAQPTSPPATSGSAAGSPSQQASTPATSPPASATPSPSLSLVAIAPGVSAGAAQTPVETLLSHYFHGINTHSYTEYAGTLTAEQQAKQTQSQFNSGYSSTTDSGMTLTGLSDNGSGLTATVTFTSRQAPAQSVDKSACNAWTLNLYLVPQGTGYLIGSAPAGYTPKYSDC